LGKGDKSTILKPEGDILQYTFTFDETFENVE
jgi:hypothetical protein